MELHQGKQKWKALSLEVPLAKLGRKKPCRFREQKQTCDSAWDLEDHLILDATRNGTCYPSENAAVKNLSNDKLLLVSRCHFLALNGGSFHQTSKVYYLVTFGKKLQNFQHPKIHHLSTQLICTLPHLEQYVASSGNLAWQAQPWRGNGKGKTPTQLQLAGFQRIQATSHPMLVLFSPLFLAFFHTNLFKLALAWTSSL